MPDTESLIRERAYAIWEQTGRPIGREIDHWFQATKEVAVAIPPPGAVSAPPSGGKSRGESADTESTSLGVLAYCFVEAAENVRRERSPHLDVERIGRGPPQHDLRFAKQCPRAHADRKRVRAQVERVKRVQRLGGLRFRTRRSLSAGPIRRRCSTGSPRSAAVNVCVSAAASPSGANSSHSSGPSQSAAR